MFQRAWKVFRKFCPLCYKQVMALSPRRIKDKFHLYFQSFHNCESFENTCENLSLILLGLMRLHIQSASDPTEIPLQRGPKIQYCTPPF